MDKLGVHSFITCKDDWKVKGDGNNYCSFYNYVVSIIQGSGLIKETFSEQIWVFPIKTIV